MDIKVIGIGDNVVDKYLHSGVMYPGGNALNFAAYAHLAGYKSAFLGAFGNDAAARHVQDALQELQVDIQRCRHYDGENGYACIRLVEGDREFVTSNKNGVLRENPLQLSDDDLEYISRFDAVHSSINGFLESELGKIKQRNVMLSFDFSGRGTDDYFQQVCPWVDYGFISCGTLSSEEVINKIHKLYDYGCKHIIATRGHKKVYYYAGNELIEWLPVYIRPVDTLGAGDAFLTGFMLFILACGKAQPEHDDIIRAMSAGGKLASQVLHHYGAFGFGKPYSD
ncbi:sugar/nucleoside kinase (ribokinase family) [Raoultella ornithinolytica]|uniref:Sugar/nucleoside kinase (Ribokinase family) n=1 Tax=Raoultella ornithinolytica TaxID=54291 RepID=A0ABD7QL78_RAOOR|nr:fructoselysine 6-kinase [Raoultella terrigena]ROS02361.1 sugar/nucleoside kinase (ribokinase family) [Raoultella terrigena]TCQ75102.1 sugar/nucleoside kinase (ribokinase family) [Raoultella ornithinolytica]